MALIERADMRETNHGREASWQLAAGCPRHTKHKARRFFVTTRMYLQKFRELRIEKKAKAGTLRHMYVLSLSYFYFSSLFFVFVPIFLRSAFQISERKKY